MGQVYKAKEVIKQLLKEGWYISNIVGSHYKLRHKDRSNYVTIPFHNKDLDKKTANSILKQAGLK